MVVAIIGLFVFFIPNFWDYQEKNYLTSALSQTRSFIGLIRQESISNLVPENCSSTDFKGYGFSLSNQPFSNFIKKFYYCPNITSTPNILYLSKFKHIQLLTNQSVYFARSTGELLENVHHQKIDLKIILKNTFTNKCASLTIDKFGIMTTNENETCP